MKPRVTIVMNRNSGLEILLNEAGRDSLILALQNLGPDNDHFHLASLVEAAEILLSSTPYSPDDQIIDFAKVSFRTDEWDAQYYPHVLSADGEDERVSSS